jgi:cytoskeleton protein RodZ
VRELGQFLRTKRESLGLSLDEVQERTKIRKRYLIALENGDWSVLPGYVYGRGFVRSYAEVLGLDGLELLQTYMDMSQESNDDNLNVKPIQQRKPSADSDTGISKEQPKREIRVPESKDERDANLEAQNNFAPRQNKKRVSRTQHERTPSPATRLLSGRKFNTFSQVAVVVGVLAIIGGGLYALNRGGKTANLPGGNAIATGSQNSTNAGQAGKNKTDVTGQTNQIGNASGNTANISGGTGQNQPAGTASIIPAAFQNNTQSYTVVTADPLSVSLTAASGDCWVKVTADNSIIDGSDMINQGIKKSWTANQNLAIRVGNVSVVQLEVNGQPVTLPQTTNAIDITFAKQQPQAQ